MHRSLKIVLIVCALATAVIVAVVLLAGPSIQRSFFYPKPRGLPSVVGQTMAELLAGLQAVLETNAPTVMQVLQPGLSDIQIAELEAGDGYFYDPERTDAQGAFFFHFAEVGYYVWFPSVRNFLSGVIECYQTRAVKATADGKDFQEDTVHTEAIWNRLGKGREP